MRWSLNRTHHATDQKMATAKYFKATGEAGDATELPADPFDGVINEAALHQVVKAYLANQRQGTASTKSRGQVAGGGRKIWRQKGTGRARQGSIRAPHWKGGGVAFGPTPRDYEQRLPKKVRALARRSAFNARAQNEQVSVIEHLDVDAPKTRRITELLEKLGLDGRKVLILTSETKPNVYLSARNLRHVKVLPFREASAYDVIDASDLLIEESALNGTQEGGDNA
ncbi:MAG: 50S ribosomal protein L4 [Gemmatimonas sp.]|nr:50S ribosomal protein L4 [Gemmatimonas sp.]